jgi:hypothetical protein
MYNGIAVGMGQNVTLTNNIVQAYTDQGSWIVLDKNTNATVSNNHASSIQQLGVNSGIVLSGNTTLAPVAVGNTAILDGPTAPSVVTPRPAVNIFEFEGATRHDSGSAETFFRLVDQDHVYGGSDGEGILMLNSGELLTLSNAINASLSGNWSFGA